MDLLQELKINCKGKQKRVVELLQVFDLANLGYDMQESMIADVYNRVLKENVFLCTREVKRFRSKIGKRITDEKDMFLLSDEDFEKVLQLAEPIMVAEHITDENGYFINNWTKKRSNARKELVEYLLTEIVPVSMREKLSACRWNIVYSDKLINAFRSSISPA